MRLHFLVLIAAVLFIVIDAHPVNRRSEEEDETGVTSEDVGEDEKKSDISEGEEEDDESAAERKTKIAKKDKKKKEAVKKKAEIKKEDKEDEEQEDDSEPSDGSSKKDAVDSKTEEKAVSEAPTASEGEKKTIEKVDEPVDKKATEKKSDDGAKKWWMVGDSEHWGGRGHGHWGPPHHAEQDNYGGGHYGGHGGHKRHHTKNHAECCKSKDKNVRKRCECSHHEDPHHIEGYHFHERGHGGHNDHDHDLKGPWAFGYDGFGDDWNDWDHNHGNFEHLQRLEKESHDGHHEHHGHDDCDKRRDCVRLPAEPVVGARLTAEPVGAPVVAQVAGPGPIAAGAGSVLAAPGAAPLLGAAGPGFIGAGGLPIVAPGGAPIVGGVAPIMAGAPLLGAGPSVLAMPDGAATLGPAPIGPGGPLVPLGAAPVANQLPYRVCHDCQILRNGGSRCLCKTLHHPGVHHASTDYDHHVYIDCDAAVHNYPAQNSLCYPRAGIPTPEDTVHEEGKAKQGVVYPYVGYGPWSAYPWWGDWWGGHGNHGWGNQQGGCEHPCEHDHHECGCHHNDHSDHVVDVNHGEALVHHDHAHNGGHDVGFSLNHGTGPHLNAYRCHDVVETHNEDQGTRSKRFCVPVGYHGGYGWPYWHGYPGVGTGLWGWGWPWIKNKVPGSKGGHNTSEEHKENNKEGAKNKNTRRSIVSKNTKKQTIHVGYGYASGDNYRLGYGYGGMGGVSGFAPGANAIGEGAPQNPFSRSKIETEDVNGSLTFAKNNIPTPEKEQTVTGSKRNFEKLNHHNEESSGGANRPLLLVYRTLGGVGGGNQGNRQDPAIPPIGYAGGYGWPYWHGYPGVGTGLWGWGWPWIKHKVPGSKHKSRNDANNNSTSTASAGGNKQNNARSVIILSEENASAKKHVLPTPEQDLTVPGTKRDLLRQ